MTNGPRNHERKVEEELTEIRRNTDPSWSRLLGQSMLRGAGFIIGTILSIAIIGWLLSNLGVIPGIGDIANTLQQILEAQTGYHN